MSKLVRFISAVAISCVATSALAYEGGDVIVRAGPALVDPQDDSSVLFLDGTPLAGTGVEVEDETQLGITITYMFSEYWGMELLAATPFTHVINAEGLGGLEVGEVDHLPPTLSGQFYPLGKTSAFQPYIGLGINYTTFFSEDLSSQFVSALGDGDLKLDDSVGLAGEIGADFALTDNLVVNASIWAVDLETEAEIDLDSGSRVEVDVDIDPIVYMVGLGYKF